jgi:hypothetical protein
MSGLPHRRAIITAPPDQKIHSGTAASRQADRATRRCTPATPPAIASTTKTTHHQPWAKTPHHQAGSTHRKGPTTRPSAHWLSFGRLRPLHTNAAIFAFAGNAIFAGVYYSTQRLCKARMFSDLLSNLHFWGWQLIIVARRHAAAGITQGKEYAELEWPIDLAIAVVWVGFFG